MNDDESEQLPLPFHPCPWTIQQGVLQMYDGTVYRLYWDLAGSDR